MQFKSLRGGRLTKVGGVEVMSIMSLLLIVHLTLAALIFANVIEFASSDAKLLIGVSLAVAAAIIFGYLLYVGISNDAGPGCL